MLEVIGPLGPDDQIAYWIAPLSLLRDDSEQAGLADTTARVDAAIDLPLRERA